MRFSTWIGMMACGCALWASTSPLYAYPQNQGAAGLRSLAAELKSAREQAEAGSGANPSGIYYQSGDLEEGRGVRFSAGAPALSHGQSGSGVYRGGASRPSGLLGTVEFRANNLNALKKWRVALDKIEEEKPRLDRCLQSAQNCQNNGMLSWRGKIESLKGQDPFEILREVNNFANKWPYTEDIHNWKVADYWASPEEFLAHSGDCEDYAIFKYVTLKRLGFEVDDMRIVVVRDTLRNVAHAVLSVQLDGTFYILDSLYDAVLPDTQVMQYLPYYSVNETTRWAHVLPKETGR